MQQSSQQNETRVLINEDFCIGVQIDTWFPMGDSVYNTLVSQLQWSKPLVKRGQKTSIDTKYQKVVGTRGIYSNLCWIQTKTAFKESGFSIPGNEVIDWDTYGPPITGLKQLSEKIAKDTTVNAVISKFSSNRNNTFRPNCCFLDLYPSKYDYSVSRAEKQSRTTVTLFLGQPRKVLLKSKDKTCEVSMKNGDILILTGSKKWKLSVPRCPYTSGDQNCLLVTYKQI